MVWELILTLIIIPLVIGLFLLKVGSKIRRKDLKEDRRERAELDETKEHAKKIVRKDGEIKFRKDKKVVKDDGEVEVKDTFVAQQQVTFTIDALIGSEEQRREAKREYEKEIEELGEGHEMEKEELREKIRRLALDEDNSEEQDEKK